VLRLIRGDVGDSEADATVEGSAIRTPEAPPFRLAKHKTREISPSRSRPAATDDQSLVGGVAVPSALLRDGCGDGAGSGGKTAESWRGGAEVGRGWRWHHASAGVRGRRPIKMGCPELAAMTNPAYNPKAWMGHGGEETWRV